ncbi:MAG: hypothetical protein KDC61_18490, partial [Saprospiraceae bacterium]|nr:hypothetical protein [Saprospiraceae bacterium]
MKNILSAFVLVFLFGSPIWAQIQNKGAFINITPGSSVIALDGVVNTDGGTLTVEGTLRTPGDLTNTTGATLQGDGQYFI